jgi:parallel beta-helix repeat protein
LEDEKMIGTRNLNTWLMICSFLLALVGTATGATLYVNTDGSGGAYTSIQAAINAAVPGVDEIEVADGDYYEAINFLGKAIRLYSSSGAALTTINATGLNSSVVTCNDSEGPDTILEGFTITRGDASGNGGGMYNDNASPMVKNCIFTVNSATNHGGGMYNWQSEPNVTDCTFSGNTAISGFGGGMCIAESNPTVTNCEFISNSADLGGGGMYNHKSSPEVTNCTFSGNSANDGAGMHNRMWSFPTVTGCSFTGNTATNRGGVMYNWDSSPTVTDCTFTGNSAESGGGIFNNGLYSNPTITQCTFSNNTADSSGGGMYSQWGSNPTVTHCTFTGNSAELSGGGMYNTDGSSPTVGNCTFAGNTAVTYHGGGMYSRVDSNPTVTECIFADNGAGFYGGGMHSSGCGPTVTNCLFRSNSANYGGGMSNYTASPTVTNCTLSNNSGDNPGMYNDAGSSPVVTNCILWGNGSGSQIVNVSNSTADVTYSDVQGGTGQPWFGTGCTDLDPIFADEDGRLSPGSPCIDVGNNSAVPVEIETDLDGNPRRVDGNFDGDPVVDIGAYEFSAIRNITQGILYETIQAAIDAAVPGDKIEVGPGTYKEAIDFSGKAIRLYSSSGPEVTTINGNEAYHVVQCVSGEESDSILEGFTITGGKAGGSSFPYNCGGGMLNLNSSPKVINCSFSENKANLNGGGMYNWQSEPNVINCTFARNGIGALPTVESGAGMYNWKSNATVSNCTFYNNHSRHDGGAGMHNYYSDPDVSNCTFTHNSADGKSGGGMYNCHSSPAVTNCTFTTNYCGAYGGAGMYNHHSSPAVTNCTFSGNYPTGYGGGGMYNYHSGPYVINCTFTENGTKSGGGMVVGLDINATYPCPPTVVHNCIFWDNTDVGILCKGAPIQVYHSDVQDQTHHDWCVEGCIDYDPLFVDRAGGDLRLSPGSPCIDMGNNSAVPDDITTDLDGSPRMVDGNFDGIETVDMGAYEYWADADKDGIEDSVDMEPDHYSDGFSDATTITVGAITDRGDQIIAVSDVPYPDGVKIKAYASTGNTPARVWFFASLVPIRLAWVTLDAGDAVVATFGSIDIAVVQGTVEMVFFAEDGTEAETTMNAGNSIEFEPETCAFTAPETNVDDVVVIVDGGEIIVGPGESKLIANVDIDPETLNLKSEGTGVTCYIELPPGFDVGEIDVSTLLLNGQVPAEPEPVEVGDYDGDGIPDLMVKFDRAATQTTLEVGDVVHISVAGQLNDGTEFEDCDVVRVIAPGG